MQVHEKDFVIQCENTINFKENNNFESIIVVVILQMSILTTVPSFHTNVPSVSLSVNPIQYDGLNVESTCSSLEVSVDGKSYTCLNFY